MLALLALGLIYIVLELGARLLMRAPTLPAEAPIKAHDLSAMDAAFSPDPYTWWRFPPNLEDFHVVGRCWGRDVDFTFSTNANGYRGAPLREGEHPRVICIGDSVTFGLGVGDAETYPRRLEERLREAGLDVEVINTGTPGYSAFQGLRLLDKYGMVLKPDVVIACFGQNDFDTWNADTDLERAQAEAANAAAEANSPSDFFVLARRALQGAQQLMADPRAPKKPRLTREEFRETLEQLRQLCAGARVPLVLLRWPQEPQVLEKNPAPIHYEDIVLDFANADGVTLVDLYPPFVEKTVPLYADPVHGNAAGCDAAAEALAPTVQALLTR